MATTAFTLIRMISDEEFYKAARHSPYVLLPGISMQRIWTDYLHIVDLALAPEAAASDPLQHYDLHQHGISTPSSIACPKTLLLPLRHCWN